MFKFQALQFVIPYISFWGKQYFDPIIFIRCRYKRPTVWDTNKFNLQATILEEREKNSMKFNANTTQYTTYSLKTSCTDNRVSLYDYNVACSDYHFWDGPVSSNVHRRDILQYQKNWIKMIKYAQSKTVLHSQQLLQVTGWSPNKVKSACLCPHLISEKLMLALCQLKSIEIPITSIWEVTVCLSTL